jgi:hypothetical protein
LGNYNIPFISDITGPLPGIALVGLGLAAIFLVQHFQKAGGMIPQKGSLPPGVKVPAEFRLPHLAGAMDDEGRPIHYVPAIINPNHRRLSLRARQGWY